MSNLYIDRQRAPVTGSTVDETLMKILAYLPAVPVDPFGTARTG
jgi:hypothetical protein